MSHQMKIIFNDNLLKIKIPTKIKVSSLFAHLKKALHIKEDSKLILLNNSKRFLENDELCQKDLNSLNKDEFILLELKDFKNMSFPKRKNLGEIKDPNNDKNKKPQSKKNNSLQEKIKSCTNARTSLSPFKVIKTNCNHHRGNYMRYYYDRINENYESSEYSYEDYDDFDDSLDEDEEAYYFNEHDSESVITFESVSVSDVSNRFVANSNYNNNHSQNLPFQIQRVYPQSQSGINSASRLRNNEVNLRYNPFVNRGNSNNNYNLNNMNNNINLNNSNNDISGNYISGTFPNQQNHLRIIENNNRFRRIINYDEEMLNLLIEMGFGLENSRIVLRLTNNNINEATLILLNAPEIIFEENRDLAGPNNNDNNPQNDNQLINLNQNNILQANPFTNNRNPPRNNSQLSINNNNVENNNRINSQDTQMILHGLSSEIDRVRHNLNNLRNNLQNIEHNIEEHELDNNSLGNLDSELNISNVNENGNRPNQNPNIRINVIPDERNNFNANELEEIDDFFRLIASNNFQVIRLENLERQSQSQNQNQRNSSEESEEDN